MREDAGPPTRVGAAVHAGARRSRDERTIWPLGQASRSAASRRGPSSPPVRPGVGTPQFHRAAIGRPAAANGPRCTRPG